MELYSSIIASCHTYFVFASSKLEVCINDRRNQCNILGNYLRGWLTRKEVIGTPTCPCASCNVKVSHLGFQAKLDVKIGYVSTLEPYWSKFLKYVNQYLGQQSFLPLQPPKTFMWLRGPSIHIKLHISAHHYLPLWNVDSISLGGLTVTNKYPPSS